MRHLALVFWALLAVSAAAAPGGKGPAVRSAVEKAWQTHTEARIRSANAQYPDDPITFRPAVGKIRMGKSRVWFEGRWTGSHPYPIPDGKVRAFISRPDLEHHLASGGTGELQVQFEQHTLPGLRRSMMRKRGSHDPYAAVDQLTSPEDIALYAGARQATDPLNRQRLADAVTSWGRPETQTAWWMALRSMDGKTPAAWPAPRPIARLVASVRRAATREKSHNWIFTAVSSVEHPQEIRGIVDFVARGKDPAMKPEVGLENLRFLAGQLIEPLQKHEWLKALAEVEAHPPALAPRLTQRPWPLSRSTPRLVAALRKGAAEKKLDWLLHAVDALQQPAEIRKVVRFIARGSDPAVKPSIGLVNLRYAADRAAPSEQVKQAWFEAIAPFNP